MSFKKGHVDIGNGLWEEVDYMSTLWSREPCGNEFLKGSCGQREWILEEVDYMSTLWSRDCQVASKSV